MKNEERSTSIVKVVLITLGVIAFIAAATAIALKFFKKHFKVNFECGDCDFCDEDGFCEDVDFEPECCVYDVCCDDCDGVADAE